MVVAQRRCRDLLDKLLSTHGKAYLDCPTCDGCNACLHVHHCLPRLLRNLHCWGSRRSTELQLAGAKHGRCLAHMQGHGRKQQKEPQPSPERTRWPASSTVLPSIVTAAPRFPSAFASATIVLTAPCSSEGSTGVGASAAVGRLAARNACAAHVQFPAPDTQSDGWAMNTGLASLVPEVAPLQPQKPKPASGNSRPLARFRWTPALQRPRHGCSTRSGWRCWGAPPPGA